MRKYFFAFALFLASLNIVSAQGNESPIRLAFVLSPQLSWLKSDNSDTETGGNRFGYNFGVSFNKFFAPNYAFHSGITINTTGGVLKVDGTTPNTTETINMRLKYLEIPFGLHLKTNGTRRMVYYGQFGVSGLINIKATDTDGNSLSSDINPFDFAYHFGLGTEYAIGGSNHLMFGLQYNNGITDVTSKSFDLDKVILNRLVFQVGLIF